MAKRAALWAAERPEINRRAVRPKKGTTDTLDGDKSRRVKAADDLVGVVDSMRDADVAGCAEVGDHAIPPNKGATE